MSSEKIVVILIYCLSMMSSGDCKDRKHFVLVHGGCHGAWSWYKLKPLLECAGHNVTAVDLAASGINMCKIDNVNTLEDYNQPLLLLLARTPPNQKVILVGYSLGGLNQAQATDEYPQKVERNVFVAAFLPDTEHRPSYVLEKYVERTPTSAWMDSRFEPSGNKTSLLFGPMFLANKLYQRSPVKDLELAKSLVRPTSLFLEDLSRQKKFSKEGYGSVPRSYIVCTEDIAIPVDYQQWMIQNAAVNNVLTIKGADHMVMNSKPRQLFHALQEIANPSRKL
ncbi:salicylic acid-binding protein 2-like isoform X2 [Vigna radiata var. radiata]|uniref:(S)-hydroxynitrile lyase n=1 Tax=Vigna radiata var. radiata TaxID=3916 RepID=A0A1S3UQJ4_VIGRR|nr:salicylic acid-binding protein 2-like isoform X2 [Vigna radiata var. radiata]